MDSKTLHRKSVLHSLIQGKPYLGNQAAFAKAAGVTKARITQLLDAEEPFGERAANSITEKLRLPVDVFDLTVGERALHQNKTEQANTPRGSNVSDGPAIKGEVPLISWVQAGDWSEANDPFQPGDAEKWMPCPVNHSGSTYALRVRGDSMTAQHGRSYPEGCIIYVDPEKRMPVNGTRIVAKLEGSNDVTFKVYKNEDGRQWLQPLNPQHPPIFDPFKVLGTVIGKWEDE